MPAGSVLAANRDAIATGGHAEEIVPVEEVVKAYRAQARVEPWQSANPWPLGKA